MGFSKHLPSNNESIYTYYCQKGDTTHKDGKNIESCGCYVTERTNESDRVWVTYYTTVIMYYKCPEHWVEHNEAVAMKEKIKEEENAKWLIRYTLSNETKEEQRKKIMDIMETCKLSHLRKMKDLCNENGWKCKFHRGYIIITFYIGEDSRINNYEVHRLLFHYKRDAGKYIFQVDTTKTLNYFKPTVIVIT